MTIKIKRISKFDKKFLKELFLKAGKPNAVPNRAFFKNKFNVLSVAYIGKETAGYSWSFVLPHPDRLKPAMFLYSIDVFEPYQRQGVGSKLIGQLKKISRQLNCFEIFVLTDEKNFQAIEFYRSTGGVKELSNSVMFIYDV
ncbi:GNAT family N-acetyltransferase [bacterium]|nr:GNAT family N-acetyltransferase [bacterium]